MKIKDYLKNQYWVKDNDIGDVMKRVKQTQNIKNKSKKIKVESKMDFIKYLNEGLDKSKSWDEKVKAVHKPENWSGPEIRDIEDLIEDIRKANRKKEKDRLKRKREAERKKKEKLLKKKALEKHKQNEYNRLDDID